MSKKLKTVEEHNAEISEIYQKLRAPTPSGVACPKCDNELWVDNSITFTSNPPQNKVHCKECGYMGFINC